MISNAGREKTIMTNNITEINIIWYIELLCQTQITLEATFTFEFDLKFRGKQFGLVPDRFTINSSIVAGYGLS